MELLLISILAGILTVLSPCVLPLLPVVLSGSVADSKPYTPLVITGSLAVSVILFTLLIRASTALIGIPNSVWFTISGLIIALIGGMLLFPRIWETLSVRLNLTGKAGNLMASSQGKAGYRRDVVLGSALGPVFTSCSPTYGLILATVIPVNFAAGFSYLLAYTLSLSAVMLLIAYGGQRIVSKLGWLSDSRGVFKRTVGVFLILIGLLIASGLMKDIEIWLVEAGFDSTRFEWLLLE